MAYSKRLSETEAQDFANEQAEKQFDHAMLHGDNFEPVNLISISSGLKDLFNESPDDMDLDDMDLDDMDLDDMDLDDMEEHQIPSNELMFPLLERDDYNSPENYGS